MRTREMRRLATTSRRVTETSARSREREVRRQGRFAISPRHLAWARASSPRIPPMRRRVTFSRRSAPTAGTRIALRRKEKSPAPAGKRTISGMHARGTAEARASISHSARKESSVQATFQRSKTSVSSWRMRGCPESFAVTCQSREPGSIFLPRRSSPMIPPDPSSGMDRQLGGHVHSAGRGGDRDGGGLRQ